MACGGEGTDCAVILGIGGQVNQIADKFGLGVSGMLGGPPKSARP
jgi:hypothetical protein